MQKNYLIKLGVTCILIAVLFFTVIRAIKRVKKIKGPGIKTQSAPLKKESRNKILSEDLFRIMEEEGRNLKLKRDPFSAATIMPIESVSSGISLNGIIWDKNNPMAIINNKIVKINDKINGNLVVDIQQNKVILNDGTKNLELKLGR